jgi:hypothetical protein
VNEKEKKVLAFAASEKVDFGTREIYISLPPLVCKAYT